MSGDTRTAIKARHERAVIERCPVAPNGEHGPHWREWRVAEREGRPIPCEHCGVTVWPVCTTCGRPRINWEHHDHG